MMVLMPGCQCCGTAECDGFPIATGTHAEVVVEHITGDQFFWIDWEWSGSRYIAALYRTGISGTYTLTWNATRNRYQHFSAVDARINNAGIYSGAPENRWRKELEITLLPTYGVSGVENSYSVGFSWTDRAALFTSPDPAVQAMMRVPTEAEMSGSTWWNTVAAMPGAAGNGVVLGANNPPYFLSAGFSMRGLCWSTGTKEFRNSIYVSSSRAWDVFQETDGTFTPWPRVTFAASCVFPAIAQFNTSLLGAQSFAVSSSSHPRGATGHISHKQGIRVVSAAIVYADGTRRNIFAVPPTGSCTEYFS